MSAIAFCLALLLPATLTCAYYLVPTLLRRRFRPRRKDDILHRHFTVLIPAHDEEATLPATLSSLAAVDYPPDRVHVLVVADNCSDRTRELAVEAGAVCLDRRDSINRGKGFALAFGFSHILRPSTDIVLVLDADCSLDAGVCRELNAAFAAGAAAVQTAVRSRNADAGPSGYVAAVGSAVDNAVAAGLQRLGISVPLRGTGMAFRRSVLEAVPWDAFSTVEDAEYGVQLARANIRVRFAEEAVIYCEAPADVATLLRQRRRWRGAVAVSARSMLVRVTASKPLVLAQLALTGMAALLWWRYSPSGWSLAGAVWAAVLVVLTAGVYVRAAVEVGLSWRRLRQLAAAPAVVARLGVLTLAGFFRRRPVDWDRTPRAASERRAA